MDWAWLAIGFGFLVIVTRTPLIFRPPETLAIYRGLYATDTRVRVMGGFFLVLGLLCIDGFAEASAVPRQLLVTFAVLFVAMAAWALAATAHFRATIGSIFHFIEESVDQALIRGLGILAVGLGGLLVYAGVRAL